jgi:hypothetical protein
MLNRVVHIVTTGLYTVRYHVSTLKPAVAPAMSLSWFSRHVVWSLCVPNYCMKNRSRYVCNETVMNSSFTYSEIWIDKQLEAGIYSLKVAKIQNKLLGLRFSFSLLLYTYIYTQYITCIGQTGRSCFVKYNNSWSNGKTLFHSVHFVHSFSRTYLLAVTFGFSK